MTDNITEQTTSSINGTQTPLSEDDLQEIIATILSPDHVLSDEDIKQFDALFNESDLDDSQREEFLQNLWNIVVAFIDYRWKTHPVQMAMDDCGKKPKNQSQRPFQDQSMLSSKDQKLCENYQNMAKNNGTKGSPA